MMNDVKVVSFRPEYAGHFNTLNREWLERFFEVEPIDIKVLENPQQELISRGGDVIFAKLGNQIVGTCALKYHGEGKYELTKMAVTPKAQGLQIGKKLGLAIIEKARERNASLLFLESNRKLTAALNLYAKLGFVEKEPPFEASEYSRADIYMEMEIN